MPIYEYECPHCKKAFEEIKRVEDRNTVKCPICKKKAILKISLPGRDWFRPFWNEHIDPKGPIWVESKKHYKRLCEERGLQARCLL